MLASLPPDIESIITRTAILDRVNGELVNLLCDRTDGALVLERLEKQNLFLVPLDAAAPHLSLSPAVRGDPPRPARAARAVTFRKLHRKAAHWFSSHGRVAEAVSHAVARGRRRSCSRRFSMKPAAGE